MKPIDSVAQGAPRATLSSLATIKPFQEPCLASRRACDSIRKRTAEERIAGAEDKNFLKMGIGGKCVTA